MIDKEIADLIGRVTGSFYIAMRTAMPTQARELADDVIHDFATSPYVRAEDRRIYGLVYDTVTEPIEEARREITRSQLRVVEGGNSANACLEGDDAA
ncbi:MAG: hypothetical protein WAV38_28760 [Xanthobacteraceae bacterium]